MSNPVSNVEIEDVLASIRRLVAEGDSPRAAKSVVDLSAPDEFDEATLPDNPASEPTPSSDAAPGKFVLTSAFRVDSDAPEGESAAQTPGSDPDPVESAEAPLLLTTPTQTPPQTPIVSQEIETKRSELESTIAELEAAISATGDDFEPDGSEKEPIMDWQQATKSGAIFASPAMRGRMGAVVSPEGGFNSRRSAPIEQVETLTLAQKMTGQAANKGAEPVDLFARPKPETPETVSSEPPAPTLASDGPEAQDAEFDEHLSSYLQNEQIIDEAKLRELVVEIVRDELQGALGERITRNVRKLVRREIYRILASEDFN